MRSLTRLSALAITGALALSACGGSNSDPSTVGPSAQGATTVATTPTTVAVTPTTVPAAVATTATTAVAAATTTTAAPAPAVKKVAANTATQAEIAAALDAAGVANASRWAVEVVEYRPYPTNDPTFAKLRQNLVKYNPGPGVVDAIVATLSL